MKLTEVPKFTRQPSYHVNSDLYYLFDHLDRYKSEYNLDINPDFQRGHVWTEDKQIAFMEYVFKGGDMSNRLLFNYPDWGGLMSSTTDIMILVDGKQRLEAMAKFMANGLPVFGYLKNEWDESSVKSACRRVSIDIHINNLMTRKEILQWYIDLNSGGVVHTDDEIRRVKDLLDKA